MLGSQLETSSDLQIQVGYEISFSFPQPTPMILTLNVHYSRASDLLAADLIVTKPSVILRGFRDTFGNWCNCLVAPKGKLVIYSNAVLRDSGLPDPVRESATQSVVNALPAEVMTFLLGSRYCETDRLSEIAWQKFGHLPPGWGKVQAVCDFVHHHIEFGYQYARPTMTAWDVFQERRGVCRDYAHLAITLCRCLNIPARYCTGYLTDIGQPPPYAPMDFAGWFEAFLGGQWHTFDPRNNTPRMGRILIAQGRDAADVAINTTFGVHQLESFRVWAHEATADQS
jgi:transglutaminase-like putative cysteine protease